MSKSSHFFGQPSYGQLINLLDKTEIIKISREHGGERYIKRFDAWTHLVTMLYAVIMRHDSLREISVSMLAEARKLSHLGISMMPTRSTLSDANARRPETVFEAVYRQLYGRYRNELCSDSRGHLAAKWMKRLQIIDSTTISLFSNLLFKGVERNPKTGRKKGGIKVHTVIHANEGVPSDVRFTSAATNDSFMLKPSNFQNGDVLAMDRAYIDYAKMEELTKNGVIYVTKLKKSLSYVLWKDFAWQNPDGLMEYRIRHVTFHKAVKNGGLISHHARIISSVDRKKRRVIDLLTNDMDSDPEKIVDIYRQRWEIELLFKQIKQNFPLRYFYGESRNAIKIQIWVTLIANLLLMVLQSRLSRRWSFSGLATIVRLTLMYYVDIYSLLNNPEKDWHTLLEQPPEAPTEPSLFD